MDASKLQSLLDANGGWEKALFISLNNSKSIHLTEDDKKNISIDGEWIKIVQEDYVFNTMSDFKPRRVVAYHAIEFVESVIFAQDNTQLLDLGLFKGVVGGQGGDPYQLESNDPANSNPIHKSRYQNVEINVPHQANHTISGEGLFKDDGDSE